MTRGFNQGAVPGEEFTEVGRTLEESEKAIKILCPIPYKYHAERNRTNEDGEIEKEIITINGVRFRLGNVFDISQCDGELDSIVKCQPTIQRNCTGRYSSLWIPKIGSCMIPI